MGEALEHINLKRLMIGREWNDRIVMGTNLIIEICHNKSNRDDSHSWMMGYIGKKFPVQIDAGSGYLIEIPRGNDVDLRFVPNSNAIVIGQQKTKLGKICLSKFQFMQQNKGSKKSSENFWKRVYDLSY